MSSVENIGRIDAILGRRQQDGKVSVYSLWCLGMYGKEKPVFQTQYLIKWVSEEEMDVTWELRDDLLEDGFESVLNKADRWLNRQESLVGEEKGSTEKTEDNPAPEKYTLRGSTEKSKDALPLENSTSLRKSPKKSIDAPPPEKYTLRGSPKKSIDAPPPEKYTLRESPKKSIDAPPPENSTSLRKSPKKSIDAPPPENSTSLRASSISQLSLRKGAAKSVESAPIARPRTPVVPLWREALFADVCADGDFAGECRKALIAPLFGLIVVLGLLFGREMRPRMPANGMFSVVALFLRYPLTGIVRVLWWKEGRRMWGLADASTIAGVVQVLDVCVVHDSILGLASCILMWTDSTAKLCTLKSMLPFMSAALSTGVLIFQGQELEQYMFLWALALASFLRVAIDVFGYFFVPPFVVDCKGAMRPVALNPWLIHFPEITKASAFCIFILQPAIAYSLLILLGKR